MSTTPDRPLTIAHELIAAATRSSNAGAILTLLDAQGEILDALPYAGLLALASRWQSYLASLGLPPGDRVVVALRHGADLYGAYLGALLGGFVPAMFAFPSPKVTEDVYFSTLRPIVHVTTPRVFITFDALRPKIEAALGDLPVRVVSPDGLPADAPLASPAEISPDATAFLQYSSGTTGLKKGVGISHAALLWQVTQYGRALGLRPDDRIASWLPLYHDMGLICGFFLPLLTGTPIVAMDPFDWVVRPTLLLDAITRHRATLCWQPNFAYSLLARTLRHADVSVYDLSSVRGWINCSEPVLDDSHRAFTKVLGGAGLQRRALAACYAMAENTFAVTMSRPGRPLSVDEILADTWTVEGRAVLSEAGTGPSIRLVSSGYPLPGTRVEIHAPDGTPLGERQMGEIVVDSPCLASGYLGQDEGDTRLSVPFRTGDLGYVAAGELYVTGRAKDLIIVAGRNIHPHDVEAIAHTRRGAEQETAALLEDNSTFNADDRQKAALAFARHAASVDPLMLGSSRAGHVSPRIAAGRGFTAFNFWTIGARVEDWYCAVLFALDEQERQGGRLRAVLIGVDAEAFSPAPEDIEPRLANSPLLARYLDSPARAAAPHLATNGDPRLARVRWQLRMATDQPWFSLNHGGPRTDRFATSTELAPIPPPLQTPDDRNAPYALRLEGFDRLAAWRVTYFLRLLELLASRQIALVCFVTPIHDELDRFLGETTHYRTRLAEIRALLAQHGPNAVWLETGTAKGFGGHPDYFMDGAHVAQTNGERLTHFLLDHLDPLLSNPASAGSPLEQGSLAGTR